MDILRKIHADYFIISQEVYRWLPTVAAGVRARPDHMGFVVDKVAQGQVFSEYFGFLANHHSTKFSILIITRGRYNRLIGGRRAEWTQLESTPLFELKESYNITVKCI
jgi:hypothetical protein